MQSSFDLHTLIGQVQVSPVVLLTLLQVGILFRPHIGFQAVGGCEVSNCLMQLVIAMPILVILNAIAVITFGCYLLYCVAESALIAFVLIMIGLRAVDCCLTIAPMAFGSSFPA